MTAPVPVQPALGAARLEVLQPDTTSYSPQRYLSGDGARANHSKAHDASGLSFTAHALEAVMAADPTVLEDAFVRVEFDQGGFWVAKGTPYLLAPGSGTVRGEKQQGAREQVPVGVGALHGLSSRCIVLPTECDPSSSLFKHTGGDEGNRYCGWQSKGYSESLHPTSWNDADVFTPSGGTSAGTATVDDADNSFTLTAHGLADEDRVRVEVVTGCAGLADGVYTVSVTDADIFTLNGAAEITTDGTATVYTGVDAKYEEPTHWDANAVDAAWVYRAAAEGGLTLGRVGTVTLTERTTLKVIASTDEAGKVYCDGPNQGGVILTLSGDETSYTDKNPRRIRLEPGTYRFSFEFDTVDSDGGDGNDSFRLAVGTIDDKGNMASVLLKTDAGTRVHRQAKNDERPGMSPMETVRRLLQECIDAAGSEAASILLGDRDFTDSADSDDQAPSEADCREWVWPLGVNLSQVLSDMADDADVDLSPSFVFSMWLDRGSDLSADVEPTLLALSWDSEPRGPNGYLTQSQDGWDLVLPTITDGAPRILGSFETGASASIGRARANARAAIRQTGRIRRYYHAKVPALAGSTPYDDYTLCDVVHGRGYRDLGLDVEVTDIAWEQGAGTVVFSLELGEV